MTFLLVLILLGAFGTWLVLAILGAICQKIYDKLELIISNQHTIVNWLEQINNK